MYPKKFQFVRESAKNKTRISGNREQSALSVFVWVITKATGAGIQNRQPTLNGLMEYPSFNTYLCLMTRFQRSTFAKVRCGILPIQIEVGRFRGQNVTVYECDRICPICRTAVESEIHFLFECPAYDVIRNEFIANIGIDPLSNSVDKMKHCMNLHQSTCIQSLDLGGHSHF